MFTRKNLVPLVNLQLRRFNLTAFGIFSFTNQTDLIHGDIFTYNRDSPFLQRRKLRRGATYRQRDDRIHGRGFLPGGALHMQRGFLPEIWFSFQKVYRRWNLRWGTATVQKFVAIFSLLNI